MTGVQTCALPISLEATSPAVHTRGFAGFFGLFIAYTPLGGALTRPQLPGLMAPAHTVSEAAPSAALGQVLAAQRRQSLQWRQRWAEFRSTPASAFSFVESLGLLYGPKLLADSLPSTRTPARWEVNQQKLGAHFLCEYLVGARVILFSAKGLWCNASHAPRIQRYRA